jgi:predicted transport protein
MGFMSASLETIAINLRFHELQDPRELARDVTGMGRWGNGDVAVNLAKAEEIPYAMGLVRQALEKQMGNGEVDE